MTERDVAGSIGPEHQAIVERLAGYVDDELGPEDRASIEAHLGACTMCRRELQHQTIIRARLMRETSSPQSSMVAALIMDRINRHESDARAGQEPRRSPGANYRRRVLPWSGWLVAAAVAGLWLWTGGSRGSAQAGSGGMNMAMGSGKLVVTDSEPGSLSSAVLTHFELVDQSDLPHQADLSELKKAIPFHVPALRSPHMRLIAAWSTELGGEPAAAIAYRCHDRLVVQYVVSEKVFFRQPQVRRAIAQQGIYAVTEGTVSTIAWPDTDSGSFLVGEFSASELADMRS